MKVHTARQAILNRQLNVVAYELLYRDGESGSYPAGMDSHVATSRMMARTQLNQGIHAVTSGKVAFINFTEQCLLQDFPTMIPKEHVVVEILETVNPTDEVYEKCSQLFKAGYKLALDDFVYKPEWLRFMKFIKIIKFDISKTPLSTLAPTLKMLEKLRHEGNLRNKIILLAERVETKAEFKMAMEMNFDLFQGYFFAKPELYCDRDVELSEGTLFRLYQELCRPSLDLKKISSCFESDEGLTYKLLAFMNSGLFKLVEPMSSIRQALVYLGEVELRKFLTLLTTSLMAKGKPKEILRMGIVRARTCENAAKKSAPGVVGEAFLSGLLSVLPAILDRPIESILEKLPVSDEIRDALLPPAPGKKESVLRIILNAAILIEKGSWHLTSLECMKLRLNYDQFCDYHKEAMRFAQRFEDASSVEIKKAG